MYWVLGSIPSTEEKEGEEGTKAGGGKEGRKEEERRRIHMKRNIIKHLRPP